MVGRACRSHDSQVVTSILTCKSHKGNQLTEEIHHPGTHLSFHGVFAPEFCQFNLSVW